MEVPRLLDHPSAGVEDGSLPRYLRTHRPLHRAQRVHVLRLGPGSPLTAPPDGEGRVHVAAQRALFHPHIGDAERAEHVAQLGNVRASDLRCAEAGAGHRLGDDLHQRDAGPVVVDERVLGALDTAGSAAYVQRLAGVLLQVHPLDADPDRLAADEHIQVAVGAQRLVVLGDLEVLRHVRVEVVLPGEPAPARDRAVQSEPDLDRVLDGQLVHHRQRAWQAETDRAGLAVRLRAEGRDAPAEHLCPGAELHVRLEAEDRLVPLQRIFVRDGHDETSPFASVSSGCPRRAVNAASTAAATRYSRSSASGGAITWSPTGSPFSGASPIGTEIAALPARLDGIVHRSARYIAIGSSARSPISNAVVGVAGDTSTSTCPNPPSKPLMISVRTCCALP